MFKELIYLNDDFNSITNRILNDNDLESCGLDFEKVSKTLRSFGGDEIASSVFYKKYALRDENNIIVEFTLDEAKDRWAKEVASIEKNKNDYEKYFRELYDYLLPGGRQMYALGNSYVKNATLSNCYVIGLDGDSIENIFDAAKNMAKTYSYGGGVGICLGKLRPKGAKVSNSAKFSTGAVSFMELYSMVTGIIGQNFRRAALLISINVDHPDIEDFIEIKHNNTDKVKYANISIKITDEFMNAVINDENFDLFFETRHEKIRKTIKARELWDKIIVSAHNSAEPGILFFDTAKNMSPSDTYEGYEIETTNPCGELFLKNLESCNLSSLLLHEFVVNPYTEEAYFDYDLFKQMIFRGVRHLDNVIDLNYNRHALSEQSEISIKMRRIGLGFTGLADAFAALNIKYDSNEAISFVKKFMEIKVGSEYLASSNLAKERGSFPIFDKDKHFERGFCKTLPEYVKNYCKENGLRNISISTVAPSGSISILAQCSSGIEPIFSFSYKRFVDLGGEKKQFTIIHPGVSRFFNATGLKTLSPCWVEAHDVDYNFRIKMQAAIQEKTDSSISSTINLPKNIDVKTVSDIYIEAWKQGLKGITVYREGSREGVLVTDNYTNINFPEMDSIIYCVKAEGGDKFYITVSYKDKDIKQPYQVFVDNYKQVEKDSFVKIGNSLIKMLKEKGVPEDRVIKYINRSNNSLAKLNRFLSLSMKTNNLKEAINVLNEHAFVGTLASKLCEILGKSIIAKGICEKCNSSNIKIDGSCKICLDCGWSGCS